MPLEPGSMYAFPFPLALARPPCYNTTLMTHPTDPTNSTNPKMTNSELIPTYELSADGESITCLVCQTVSHNTGDVRYLYCFRCKSFHNRSSFRPRPLTDGKPPDEPR